MGKRPRLIWARELNREGMTHSGRVDSGIKISGNSSYNITWRFTVRSYKSLHQASAPRKSQGVKGNVDGGGI